MAIKKINIGVVGSTGSIGKTSLKIFKKYKKKFNIAGKMNLNEWKGKKNIEFIIEDISLN